MRITGFSPRVPDWPFVGVILLRSCVVWLGVRVAIAMLGDATLEWLGQAAVVVLVVVVCRLESRRSNESLFLENLAVPPRVVMSLTAVCPVLFELALAWVSP